MTFVFGRGWVVNEKTDGEDGNGATGGAAGDTKVVDGEGGDEVVDGEAAEPVAGSEKKDDAAAVAAAADAAKTKVDEPKDMKAAIDKALGYDKGTKEAAEKKAAEDKAAAELAAKVEAGGKWPNGTPKLNAKGEAQGEDAKPVKAAAPKLKTSAELDLKPEEKKALHAKTQARFGEVISTLKQREEAFTQLENQHKAVVGARDTLFQVFEEARMSKEALGQWCLLNDYLTSGDPAKLEDALKMLNAQRVEVLKALGREDAGVDLLKDFPDLTKQVEDEEITRAAALEIAKGRRDRAAAAAQAGRQKAQQDQKTQSAEQFKKESDKALGEIQAWTAGLAKSDLDYKAKEDKLLAKLDGVLKDYTPDKWLPTLKLLYEGIEIHKAPVVGGGQKQPLRPSGARPGGKAPNSMLDAINQGLGYAGAEKG